jgi:iron-sulfur cluster insertion protein
MSTVMTEPSAIDYSTRITDADIHLTPAAQDQMRALLAAAEDEFDAVRVFVQGGGCGGMDYGMTYADRLIKYDSMLEGDGFKIVVDAVALNYLQGCEIDFVEQGPQGSFVFNNVFKSVGGSGVCGGCGGGGF